MDSTSRKSVQDEMRGLSDKINWKDQGLFFPLFGDPKV